jgi:hypothetical protein
MYHVCKWKHEPVETISGMGEIWRMMEGVNSTIYIVRTFVNVTMYPQYNNNKKKITLS